MKMKRTRRKRSSVWGCFQQEGDFVRCMKCDAKLKYCGRATSSMIYHMSRHPAEDDEKPPLFSAPCPEEEESPGANPDLLQVANMLPAVSAPPPAEQRVSDCGEKRRLKRSSVWDIFVRVNDEAHCTMCDTKLKYRSSTTSMMYHIKNKHPYTMPHEGLATHAEVTELISRMIEKDMLPITVVDGDGFRELLSYTVHNYKMPSVGDITRLIESHFQEKIAELSVKVGTAEKLALSADCWSVLPSQSYITVSCAFITEEWQGVTAVLQTHKVSVDGHTEAAVFTESLLNTVEMWGIAGKVTACVHNYMHDIMQLHTCTQVPWDYATCFARTLQLAVSDGLSDDLLRVIVAAGKLVEHFNHNMLASEALVMKQAHMCLPQHKLIKSSKGRWDTIYDMFERLLEQRWAIKAVLSDRMVTNRHEAQMLEIEDDYWQVIENFTPVLATLKGAITVIAADTVSISNIYPISFSLIQTHLVPKEHDVEQVVNFKLRVQKSLKNHMEVDSNHLASKPALIASMLDPRHKHLSFLTPSGRLAAKVKLHELVSKLDMVTAIVGTKDEKQEMLITPDVSHVVMPSQIRGDTKNTMMLLLGDNYSSSYGTDSEAQVDYYLRDISPSLEVNPLDWWRVNGPRFPRLATLAKYYLCIPGVSLPCLLSEAGQTFATLRTRLSPEHVDMMIFLNRNA
ncbi:zinc finger BED domain-containing protein 1-like [Thalassophryne amazonica]|uniref:zinc finger BED domain-containing protein 1-like n=1 Tax=Thalassophryne amazonica TaxID=390379 RepID=UPI0014720DB7|nr:zinc finger BED domain-containing protein 1-like [Thalassophryne amazonica]